MTADAVRTIGQMTERAIGGSAADVDPGRLPRLDPTHTPLRVDIGRPGPDVATLELFGEVDVATAPLLVACLESVLVYTPRQVVVSLAHVDFLGVCGLEALSDARDELARTGGTLRLASVSPGVRRVLALTRLAWTLPVYPTVSDAISRTATPAA